MDRPIRVLIAKIGLDGHDRGAKAIALGLRDLGFEVIFTGLRRNIGQVVRMAVEEDVDVVGVSDLADTHRQLFPEVARALRAEGLDDVLLIGGGIIESEVHPELQAAGYGRIFGPGTSVSAVAEYIRTEVQQRRG